MDRPSPEIVDCPHCGAQNFAIDDVCMSCGRKFTIVIGPIPRVRRVSLGSLMMIIGVIAICLAPVRSAPGISILLAMILVPATTRAVLNIERRKLEGRPMITEEKITAYFDSTVICFGILLAASAAFVVTCVPTALCYFNQNNTIGGLDRGLTVACIAGAIPALFVVYRLAKTLWPYKRWFNDRKWPWKLP